MPSSDLAQIASYASAVEADQMRAVLEEHGVTAFVDGAAAQTALSYVGSALGGVKLLVRATDAEKAIAIIDMLGGSSDLASGEWFCGECEEIVDAGFDVCWSCGKARSDVERPLPAFAAAHQAEAVSELDHHAKIDAVDETDEDRLNPYASPRDNTPPPKIAADEDVLINPEAEAILLRAWRASVIGLMLFPLITHLYSMYLLIRASMLTTKFSPAGNRRFYSAFVLNMVAGYFAVFFFAWFL